MHCSSESAPGSLGFDALLEQLAREHRRVLEENAALKAKTLEEKAALFVETARHSSLATSSTATTVAAGAPSEEPARVTPATPPSAAQAPAAPTAPSSAAPPPAAQAPIEPPSETPENLELLLPLQVPTPVEATSPVSGRESARSQTTPCSGHHAGGSLATGGSFTFSRLVEAGIIKSPSTRGVSFCEDPSRNPQGADDGDEEEALDVLPMWKMRRRDRCPSRKSAQVQSLQDSSMGESTAELVSPSGPGNHQASLPGRLLSRLVLSPDCTRRLTWDALSLALTGYDCITTPLQVFDLPPNDFTDVMAWLATGFWTADVAACFLVGFYRDGVVEMRPSWIAANYFRTWLFVDLSLVAVDWTAAMVAMGEADRSSAGVGVLRVGKLVKVLRLVRLARLLKAKEVLNALIERIQSEWCLIMIGILKLLLFILLLNHFIACGWCGVAVWRGIEGDLSWVTASTLNQENTMYWYLTSLHWSLTQFTPASMEVVPRNSAERLFAVCTITFAMVTFSSFVSAITNAMTQLRNLNRERNEQLSTLRRYLGQNRISSSLTGRIWGCLHKAIGQSRRRLHEDDLAILQVLPWSLKSELQEEVYAPILAAHPLFRACGLELKSQMRKLYQRAVEEVFLGVGQELFNSGQTADRMFFVISGTLNYRHEEPSTSVSRAQAGQWLCEPVLWTRWRHSGQLIAATRCELLALRASRLQEVLAKDLSAKRYAAMFVMYFQDNPDALSDTWDEVDVIEEMVAQAFLDEDVPLAPPAPLSGSEDSSCELSVVPTASPQHSQQPSPAEVESRTSGWDTLRPGKMLTLLGRRGPATNKMAAPRRSQSLDGGVLGKFRGGRPDDADDNSSDSSGNSSRRTARTSRQQARTSDTAAGKRHSQASSGGAEGVRGAHAPATGVHPSRRHSNHSHAAAFSMASFGVEGQQGRRVSMLSRGSAGASALLEGLRSTLGVGREAAAPRRG